MFRLMLLITISALVGQATTPVDSVAGIPEWGNIEIETQVSKDSLPQNDTLIVTVRLKITGNPDDYAIADPQEISLSNLKTIATGQANKTEGSGGQVKLIKEYTYTLSPITIGMAYVNPIHIQYVYVPNGTSRTISSSRLEINVSEATKPPVRIPWIPTLAIIAILGIGCGTVFFFLKRKKKARENVETPVSSPEQTAREALKTVKKDFSSNTDRQIDSMSKVLSTYLKEKYDLDMKSLAGDVVVANLEVKGVPGATLSAVKNALFICNQVRFAAHSATEADSQIVELGVEAIISYGEKKTSEPQDSELSKNKNKQ